MSNFVTISDDDGYMSYSDTHLKPTVRVLSHIPEPVVPFQEIPNPVYAFDTLVPALRDCANFTSDLAEPNFTVPDQYRCTDQYVPPHERFSDIVNECHRILSHDYIPINIREKQATLAKAFAAPVISMLNAELANFPTGYRALVLGSGRGKDVSRMIKANPNMTKLVCVEPRSNDCALLKTEFPGALVYCSTVRDSLDMIVSQGPYDIIVANMSFHYIMGVPSGKLFIEKLPSLLTERGLMYGSYVDIPSVKASSMAQYYKSGHSVQYIGENTKSLVYGEKPINGIASVSMGGVVWDDPYLHVEQIYEMFEDIPVSINIYHGTSLVKATSKVKGKPPIYTAPANFESVVGRPELTMYRAVIVHRDFTLWQTHHNFADVPHAPTTSVRWFTGTGMSERSVSLSYNKGLPLLPYEEQYINSSSARMAVKRDGIMAKLIYSHKSLEIHAEDGNSYHIPHFTGKYLLDFILQIEIVPIQNGMTGHALKRDKTDMPVWIVVTDVLLPPWGGTGSFISRWKWLMGLYDEAKWPFVLQEWVSFDDPRCLEMLGTAPEGVVIQSLLAPPNAIKAGAGSARYVKRVYTVDVRDTNGGIAEVTLNGEYVRPRLDKTIPNPPKVVERIRSAVDYPSFCLLVMVKFFCTPGASWAKLLGHIVARDPPSEWDVEEKLLFYANRYNWIFQMLCPEYVRVLNEHFTKHLLDNSKPEVKLAPFEYSNDNNDDFATAYSLDMRGGKTDVKADPIVRFKPYMYDDFVMPDIVAPNVDPMAFNSWPEVNMKSVMKWWRDMQS